MQPPIATGSPPSGVPADRSAQTAHLDADGDRPADPPHPNRQAVGALDAASTHASIPGYARSGKQTSAPSTRRETEAAPARLLARSPAPVPREHWPLSRIRKPAERERRYARSECGRTVAPAHGLCRSRKWPRRQLNQKIALWDAKPNRCPLRSFVSLVVQSRSFNLRLTPRWTPVCRM